MNFKAFIKLLLAIYLLSAISCQTQKISFNPKKITQLEKAGYTIKFDNQVSDFKNFLVSKHNINSATKDDKRKTIQINLKKSSQIITGAEMLVILKEKYKVAEIDMLIINNELYNPDMNNLFFDVNSFDEPKIIKVEKLRQNFTHREWNGDMVLLPLKN